VPHEKSTGVVSDEMAPQTTQVFVLPEVLPAHKRIVLNVHAHVAVLLELDGENPAPLVRSFPLSPSASRIFLALLQAYPQHCPYPTLFLALYLASQEALSEGWEQYVRPIRRALRYLTPVMRSFGLQVIALREHGYLLSAFAPVSTLPQKRQMVTGRT
jgi:hypothetical protein